VRVLRSADDVRGWRRRRSPVRARALSQLYIARLRRSACVWIVVAALGRPLASFLYRAGRRGHAKEMMGK
jgi:hypothetical protein